MQINNRLTKLETKVEESKPKSIYEQLVERQRKCRHLEVKFFQYGTMIDGDRRCIVKCHCLHCGLQMPILYFEEGVDADQYVARLTHFHDTYQHREYRELFNRLYQSGEMTPVFHPVSEEVKAEFLARLREVTPNCYLEDC